MIVIYKSDDAVNIACYYSMIKKPSSNNMKTNLEKNDVVVIRLTFLTSSRMIVNYVSLSVLKLT